MIKCSKCGILISDTNSPCPNCGQTPDRFTRTVNTEPKAEDEKQPRYRSAREIASKYSTVHSAENILRILCILYVILSGLSLIVLLAICLGVGAEYLSTSLGGFGLIIAISAPFLFFLISLMTWAMFRVTVNISNNLYAIKDLLVRSIDLQEGEK